MADSCAYGLSCGRKQIRVEPDQHEFFEKQKGFAGSTPQPESAGWNSEFRVAVFAGFEYFQKKFIFSFDFHLFFSFM